LNAERSYRNLGKDVTYWFAIKLTWSHVRLCNEKLYQTGTQEKTTQPLKLGVQGARSYVDPGEAMITGRFPRFPLVLNQKAYVFKKKSALNMRG